MKIFFTGDLHLTPYTPVCRSDDYKNTQFLKLHYLLNLVKQEPKGMLALAGDIFDYWKVPLEYLYEVTEIFKQYNVPIFSIAGQHELPNHSYQLYKKSAYYNMCVNNIFFDVNKKVVDITNTIKLSGAGYEENPVDILDKSLFNILIQHKYVYNETQIPDASESSQIRNYAKTMSDAGFKLVVTGDNHIPFIYTSPSITMINVGSMTRKTADQIDYIPHFYSFDCDTKEIKKHPFPIVEGVIVRDHIEQSNERKERLEAFVKKIKTDSDLSCLSFEDILKEAIKTNKPIKEVEELLWEVLSQD